MTSFNILIHTMLDKEKWKEMKERREKKEILLFGDDLF
jgi:hypothetical protein